MASLFYDILKNIEIESALFGELEILFETV